MDFSLTNSQNQFDVSTYSASPGVKLKTTNKEGFILRYFACPPRINLIYVARQLFGEAGFVSRTLEEISMLPLIGSIRTLKSLRGLK